MLIQNIFETRMLCILRTHRTIADRKQKKIEQK